jgi:hypothetical protein
MQKWRKMFTISSKRLLYCTILSQDFKLPRKNVTLLHFLKYAFLEKKMFSLLKGIVQPFELGGVTRLIRSTVKFCMAGNLKKFF